MARKQLGASPSGTTDAATKAYVDTAVSTYAPLASFQSIATAAGTTTLTSASPTMTQFTGSTTQTCVLPNATTLTVGRQFVLSNVSTGSVQVNANGGGAIQTLFTTSEATLTCTSIGTSAGTWDVVYLSTGGSVGVAAKAYVATSESTTSTTYTDLTTTTDSVTVTIGASGMAQVFISSQMFQTSAQNYSYMSFAVSGANTQAASDAYSVGIQSAATGTVGGLSAGAPFLLTGLTPGSTTFKAKYRSTYSGGTATFTDRRISVIPINNTNLWAGLTSNLEGAFSSLPAAGAAGRLYTATDTGVILQDNGSTWDRVWIGDATVTTGATPTSGWTAVNMLSGSSWAADKDGMLFTASTSQTSLGYQYRTYPGSPFTLTTYMDVALLGWANVPTSASNALTTGIFISDGTSYINVGPYLYNTGSVANASVAGFVWSNTSTTAGTYNGQVTLPNYLTSFPKWFRFADNGTNRIMSYSQNGLDWNIFYTESRTAGLTPTRIGIGLYNLTGYTGVCRVRSWNGVA